MSWFNTGHTGSFNTSNEKKQEADRKTQEIQEQE